MGNYFSHYYETVNNPTTKYGWVRDLPDIRDKFYKPNLESWFSIANEVDLRSKCPPIYNQGKLGSCTANAIAFAYQYDENKQNTEDKTIPSRLFIYYNEREMEGTINSDSGAQIRDGIKSINKVGICDETMWPYDISKFTEKPTENCYKFAKSHHSLLYRRVNQSISSIRNALNEGYPVVFGFSVYESFESEEVAKTGLMPMPKENEKVLGGHAVAVVGYCDKQKHFIIRNSWGEEWGDEGYFYMPYKFITNPQYANDFWTVETITQK